MSKKKLRNKQQPKLDYRDLVPKELTDIIDKTRTGPLSESDHATLRGVAETLLFVLEELKAKRATVARLRQILFGSSTESTRNVVGPSRDGGTTGDNPAAAANAAPGDKPKRPGHGRNGAAAFPGAKKVKVPHESLRAEDPCPLCQDGSKLYPYKEPAVRVRVWGMSPLTANVYELQRLRCGTCQELFTAAAPEGVGEEKYDETAAAMIALLKYGCGMPFYRLEQLQKALGIPLPAATQWDLVLAAAQLLTPAHAELIRQAAQGQLLHNDDTTMKVLKLTQEALQQAHEATEKAAAPRTGIFTTGIVATADRNRIALFFTGRKHAGENLADVLAQRAAELSAPIQMCDALSRNAPGDFATILANCITHARRNFVEVVDNFPDECKYVLEALRDVYRNDAVTVERKMSADERLQFHQAESGPIMKRLEDWLRSQLDEHKVEPNSELGEAIKYMLKHWGALTLFLRQPGAPLDNNICERALKKAILHRKNALFYKTEAGARVGDLFMALIHTSELAKVNPFDFLTELMRHHAEVARSPADWMPWNYRVALDRATAPPGPAGPA